MPSTPSFISPTSIVVPDSVSNPLGYYRMGAQVFRAQPLPAASPILLKMPPAGWNGSRLLQSHSDNELRAWLRRLARMLRPK